MDGFDRPGVLGILYAEDFGLNAFTATEATAPAPPALPVLAQADLEAACVRAVHAAEAAWAATAEERRAEALTAIAAHLDAARAAVAAQVDAAAEGIAGAVLGMVAGVLPNLARAHGDAEVRALVQHLAPLIARSTPLVVRVHPGLVEVLAEDVAGLDEQAAARIELRPANLLPGDVRLMWEDGSLVRDAGALCAAVRDSLSRCGLTCPDMPIFQTGSPALAE